MGAMDTLRLEKGYRLWGGDVYTDYNPYEAGLGWTVRLDKAGDFLGKAACQKLKEKGLKKKLVCLVLEVAEGEEAAVFGYEPIYDGEACVGQVTTGGYGYSVGQWIAYGYVPVGVAKVGKALEVVYFGRKYKATVAREPLFDPSQERLKG